MNHKAKLCRKICPMKSRAERVACRIKGPCEFWKRERKP